MSQQKGSTEPSSGGNKLPPAAAGAPHALQASAAEFVPRSFNFAPPLGYLYPQQLSYHGAAANFVVSLDILS